MTTFTKPYSLDKAIYLSERDNLSELQKLFRYIIIVEIKLQMILQNSSYKSAKIVVSYGDSVQNSERYS